MFDKNIINNLEQEYNAMAKYENIFRSLGLKIPVNTSFYYVCKKISNIIMQDIYKILKNEIKKLQTEQDRVVITLINEQLYNKYGDLEENKENEK